MIVSPDLSRPSDGNAEVAPAAIRSATSRPRPRRRGRGPACRCLSHGARAAGSHVTDQVWLSLPGTATLRTDHRVVSVISNPMNNSAPAGQPGPAGPRGCGCGGGLTGPGRRGAAVARPRQRRRRWRARRPPGHWPSSRQAQSQCGRRASEPSETASVTRCLLIRKL